MSYILDALKKSDQERKRGDVPNLQTVHIPMNAEPQTPVLLYGFILVLIIALAFVIGLVVSHQNSDAIQIKNNYAQEKQEVSKSIVAEPVKKVDKIPEPIVKDKAAKPENIAKIQEVSGEVKQDKQIKLKPVRVDKKSPLFNKLDLSNIPYLHELPDYKQQSIPEMNFAGHVYSTTPSSRSVIINDAAMSQGDVIVQGLNVVEITPGGVVFSLHNELFRMDILQDWSFE